MKLGVWAAIDGWDENARAAKNGRNEDNDVGSQGWLLSWPMSGAKIHIIF